MHTGALRRPLRVLTYTGPGPVVRHTLDDVRSALVALGHDVFVQDLAALERDGAPSAAIDLAIVDGLVELEPDLVLTIDNVGLIPAYLASLEHAPLCASWFFDDPIRCMREGRMDFRQIDSSYHVVSWDAAYLPSLRALGFSNLHHVPMGTNPAVYRPTPVGHAYDVSFVGTATEARRELLLRLARLGIRLDVFGRGWERDLHPHLRAHDPADNRSECPAIFTRSKINLNLTSAQQIESIPLRVFDVLACGGFLLTDLRADSERLFEPGRHFESYRSFAELVRKIRENLPRPARRHQIGAAGREHVLAHFTFQKLVGRLLEQVGATGSLRRGRDRPRPDHEALLADWLVGLAYLKAGKLESARPRLERSGHGRLIEGTVWAGGDAPRWSELYAPLGALPLGADGHIAAARARPAARSPTSPAPAPVR